MFKTVLFCLIEDMIRNISGPLGIRLRRSWYSKRFLNCGKGLTIEVGVDFQRPDQIEVGSDVWIDRHAVLIAGSPRINDRTDVRGGKSPAQPGKISIGNNSHIGIGTIIQGHGGVQTGAEFTTSAGVKIYSYSNDYKKCLHGTIGVEAAYVLYPVQIGRNVWLGLNTIVVGHTVGDNSFIMPGSIVTSDIPNNVVAVGNPAKVLGPRFDHLGDD